jgi:hypothetical protein
LPKEKPIVFHVTHVDAIISTSSHEAFFHPSLVAPNFGLGVGQGAEYPFQ